MLQKPLTSYNSSGKRNPLPLHFPLGSAAAGGSLVNPGAGQDARGMPGGPSVVTEGYIRARPLPPTLGPKTGGLPRHFRFTEAPVIYSVSCV